MKEVQRCAARMIGDMMDEELGRKEIDGEHKTRDGRCGGMLELVE